MRRHGVSEGEGMETATLAGGCFWCMEAVFERVEGVLDVRSGYAGGHTERPTYEQVCSGDTGHAEVVRIRFDPSVIAYGDLLEIFFAMHDPTTPDRQGADVGTQYRSAILYESDAQRDTARATIRSLDAERIWDAPIVTEVLPLVAFWPAEEYHREYFRRNPAQPYCQVVVAPKVAKLRKKFAHRLRTGS
jgi:peptide-methionine (S)-S-oxide reductase